MAIVFDFSHKCVVVTGGANGIGLEIARQFLSAGARVEIWDFVDTQSAGKTGHASAQTELASFGNRVTFQHVDVSKTQSCELEAANLPFQVDILVNNAGITRDKSLAKMSSEDFDAVVATNLNGVFYVTKSLLPKFSADSSPKRIVNIASVVALYGNFGQTNYVAAKAGVIGMTKTWARELAKKGFTTNAIAPGFVLTSMVEDMPAAAREKLAERIPVGRLAHPREIANTCLFLACETSGYINGAVVSVDGGLVA
jgi:3-oxoacyl-[acyl-carrier protein] reductase